MTTQVFTTLAIPGELYKDLLNKPEDITARNLKAIFTDTKLRSTLYKKYYARGRQWLTNTANHKGLGKIVRPSRSYGEQQGSQLLVAGSFISLASLVVCLISAIAGGSGSEGGYTMLFGAGMMYVGLGQIPGLGSSLQVSSFIYGLSMTIVLLAYWIDVSSAKEKKSAKTSSAKKAARLKKKQ